MTRPLSEYWIAASHHIYQDPPMRPSAAEPEATGPWSQDDRALCPQPLARLGLQDDPLGTSPLLRALKAGCRCLCLALAQEGQDVQVLLQRDRVPFQDALGLIGERAFDEENPWPLLLVLHLAASPPSLGAVVSKMLEDSLGSRLWAGSEERLPSPEEAKEKIVVVFAPDAPGR